MNNKKQEVMRRLKGLIESKTNREVSEEVIETYVEAFEGFTPDQIIHGMKQCSKTKTYGIQPSDIIEHLKPLDADFRAVAEQELAKVVKAVSRDNERHLGDDKTTLYIIRQTGFENLTDYNDFDWSNFKRSFIARYMDSIQSESVQEHIKLGKGGNTLQLNSLAGLLTQNRLKE